MIPPITASAAFAVTYLQLFINDATYERNREIWETDTESFDFIVISGNHMEKEAKVSITLAQADNPCNMEVIFVRSQINSAPWRYGNNTYDYLLAETSTAQMPQHSIFATWFTEIRTAAYNLGQMWNPSKGVGNDRAREKARIFHIDTGRTNDFLHFNTFKLNGNGQIDKSTFFPHYAQTNSVLTSEPGTSALFGVGIFGIG